MSPSRCVCPEDAEWPFSTKGKKHTPKDQKLFNVPDGSGKTVVKYTCILQDFLMERFES